MVRQGQLGHETVGWSRQWEREEKSKTSLLHMGSVRSRRGSGTRGTVLYDPQLPGVHPGGRGWCPSLSQELQGDLSGARLVHNLDHELLLVQEESDAELLHTHSQQLHTLLNGHVHLTANGVHVEVDVEGQTHTMG